MIISLIVAVDEGGGIGWQGRLPWHLSDDLRKFKSLTMGHHLIVGRKTFVSIGRPLPGRNIIVITRQTLAGAVDGSLSYAPSLEAALALAACRGESEAFIGGGAQIYALALPLAQRIYRTRIHVSLPADVFFPPFDETAWIVRESVEYTASEKNQFSFTWQWLEKIQQP